MFPFRSICVHSCFSGGAVLVAQTAAFCVVLRRSLFVPFLCIVSFMDSREVRLRTKLYYKRNLFNFHNVYQHSSSNSIAYEVYLSQLIHYSRACSSYHYFLDRGVLLKMKLPNQMLVEVEVISSKAIFISSCSKYKKKPSIFVCNLIKFVKRERNNLRKKKFARSVPSASSKQG